jgi:hypothetical protein
VCSYIIKDACWTCSDILFFWNYDYIWGGKAYCKANQGIIILFCNIFILGVFKNIISNSLHILLDIDGKPILGDDNDNVNANRGTIILNPSRVILSRHN